MLSYVLLHALLARLNMLIGKFSSAKTIEDKVPQFDIVVSNFGIPLASWPKLVDYSLALSISLLLPFATPQLYCKFVVEHAALIFIRGSALVATVGYVSFRKFQMQDAAGPCLIDSGHSDLTVSGHAMVQVLVLCFIWDLAPIYYSMFASIIVLVSLCIIVLAGNTTPRMSF